MKKLLSVVMVMVCLAMSLPAQAQFQFGLKGGLDISKVSFSRDIVKGDNTTGFFIGPMAEFTLPVLGIGIDAAALYSQSGLKAKSEGETYEKTFRSIEIPVNLKWTLGLGRMLGIYLAAGPQFGFAMNNSFDGYKTKDCAISVNVGAGLKLIKHLQVGISYNIGASELADSLNEQIVDNIRKNSWQISLAYMF